MNPELQKYVEMFASMSTDCLLGGITIGTFIANAKIAIREMERINEELTP